MGPKRAPIDRQLLLSWGTSVGVGWCSLQWTFWSALQRLLSLGVQHKMQRCLLKCDLNNKYSRPVSYFPYPSLQQTPFSLLKIPYTDTCMWICGRAHGVAYNEYGNWKVSNFSFGLVFNISSWVYWKCAAEFYITIVLTCVTFNGQKLKEPIFLVSENPNYSLFPAPYFSTLLGACWWAA